MATHHHIVKHPDGSQHLRHLGGWKRQAPDSRDYRFCVERVHALPQSFTNEALCSAVRDQGPLGSCTAYMTSGLVESREIVAGRKAAVEYAAWRSSLTARDVALAPAPVPPVVRVSNISTDSTGNTVFALSVTPSTVQPPAPIAPVLTPRMPVATRLNQLSTLFQYHETLADAGTPTEDAGATIRGAIAAAAKHGCVAERAYPYVPTDFAKTPPASVVALGAAHRVTAYHSIPDGDLVGIKSALAAGYLVGFGFDVYSYFMSEEMAKTGILPNPSRSETLEGGHAVCAVGYDDTKKMVLVRNSWGDEWGINGYFWMSYGYFTGGLATDFWVVEAAPRGF